jgi:hypothetical protein
MSPRPPHAGLAFYRNRNEVMMFVDCGELTVFNNMRALTKTTTEETKSSVETNVV